MLKILKDRLFPEHHVAHNGNIDSNVNRENFLSYRKPRRERKRVKDIYARSKKPDLTKAFDYLSPQKILFYEFFASWPFSLEFNFPVMSVFW